jgi:cyclophilin family peptidyl-prolyl cis-trans isomerase
VSKKSHRKQVQRARTKRQQDRFQRRSARNRLIILVMAVLMVLSLVAIPLTQWLADRGDAAAPPEPEDLEPASEEPEQPDAASETAGRADAYDEPFDLTIDPDAAYTATFVTDEGDIVLALDAQGAPNTVNNLVNLARDGYYDGVIFHRVIDGFMIQGGDPTGTGAGGPGYRFEDELEVAQELVEEHGGYPRGTLAMANAGPDTNGSQFFIVHADYPLPPQYAVFGEVVDGMEVVDAIATAAVDGERPVEPVAIQTIEIDEE